MSESEANRLLQIELIGVLAAVLLLTLLGFLAASSLIRVLGVTGINVVTRGLGILLAALATQYIVDGVGAIWPTG